MSRRKKVLLLVLPLLGALVATGVFIFNGSDTEDTAGSKPAAANMQSQEEKGNINSVEDLEGAIESINSHKEQDRCPG